MQTTMREANDRGYDCLLVEDATESYFPEFKAATLAMIRAQGGIVGWTAPLAALEAAVARRGRGMTDAFDAEAHVDAHGDGHGPRRSGPEWRPSGRRQPRGDRGGRRSWCWHSRSTTTSSRRRSSSRERRHSPPAGARDRARP